MIQIQRDFIDHSVSRKMPLRSFVFKEGERHLRDPFRYAVRHE